MTADEIIKIVGGLGTLGAGSFFGIKAAFKFLVMDRIIRAEEKEDEKSQELEVLREECADLKVRVKATSSALRRTRRLVEEAAGAPQSMPPHSTDGYEDEKTQPAIMMSEEDMRWLREQERRREARVSSEVLDFLHDMDSDRPKEPPPYRPKQKSRRDAE